MRNKFVIPSGSEDNILAGLIALSLTIKVASQYNPDCHRPHVWIGEAGVRIPRHGSIYSW